jgi:hypothetical protein
MKVFVEEQRFNQWWLYLLLAIPLISLVIPFIFNSDDYVNGDKETLTGITISLVSVVIVTMLILSIRLRTKIDENGIYYQFYPINFNEKFIPWRDISNCFFRKYNPLTEYGGWGYRSGFGRRKGRALNIRGNQGIQLELKNGKKLLLGTQKGSEVEKVLLTYKHKIESHEN